MWLNGMYLGASAPVLTMDNSGGFSTGIFATKTPGSTPSQTVVTSPPSTAPVVPIATGIVAPSNPWYMTWWGIGLIAVAGYFGYKKFLAKK